MRGPRGRRGAASPAAAGSSSCCNTCSPAPSGLRSCPGRCAATQFLKLDRLGAGAVGLGPGARREAARNWSSSRRRCGKPIRSELPPVTPAVGPRRHRVAFFLGCMMNVAMPDVSRATVRVLARAGCEVVTPRGQACCGAPQDDQAMLDLSRDMARRNIALFEPLLDEVEAIVTDCAGCSAGAEGIRRVAARRPGLGGAGAGVQRQGARRDRVAGRDLAGGSAAAPRAGRRRPITIRATWRTCRTCAASRGGCWRASRGWSCGRCPTATRCAAAAARASTT